MNPDTGILYSPDNIDPEYNVGFGVSVGPQGATATVNGGVTNSPGATPGCTTCGAKGFMGLSWPIILIGIAVLVLALRK